MVKVAFCDDDVSVINDLSVLLEQYRIEQNREIQYVGYRSPLDLMADMERGQRWDVLFLDVVMPGTNGMEVAKEIRSYDQQIKIIFLTSSPEFAVQSYTVGAYYYQVKPVHAGNFFPVMDRVMEDCVKVQREKLVLKCKSGITAVAPEKLEYCEVIGHSLLLHLHNGRVLESVGKLDDLEKSLIPFGGFLRVHRSFLVNMAYIQSISYRSVILTCLREIPIPHGKYNDIKKLYLAYAFEKERVLL